MRLLIAGLAVLGAILGPLGPGTARADGPPTSAAGSAASPAPAAAPVPAAPMLLNMLSRPVESQEAAFRESIRQAARSAESGPSDGTIRIGGATLTIVVKDPCP